MLSRREFLRNVPLAVAASSAGCGTFSRPDGWIDTHTHFYDPRRPEGVDWPPKDDPILYRTILPEEYRRLAEPLGIGGTVVVEASPRESDNDWILRLAESDPFLLGLVGYLRPGQPGFVGKLDRLSRNPKFRGIRIGGWGDGLRLSDPTWVADLERISERGLTVDVLVPPDHMPEVDRLAARFPRLKLVVDHCGNVRMGPPPHPPAWVDGIVACHYRDNVFMKVSGLVEGTGRADGTAPRDGATYRPVLETLWRIFGEDRLLFGTNWPVSSRFAPPGAVFGILDDFLRVHGREARDKVLARNAVRVYGLRRT